MVRLLRNAALLSLALLVGCSMPGFGKRDRHVADAKPAADRATRESNPDDPLERSAYIDDPLGASTASTPNRTESSRPDSATPEVDFDTVGYSANPSPRIGTLPELPPESADEEIAGSQVVATVNGQPIFASEVLERYGKNLAQAKEQMPPADYRKLRRSLIQRDLRYHIERKVLVHALKAKLKPEQHEQLQGHLDKMFEEEVARLEKELKVNSKLELERELEKQGTSLTNLRTAFAHQRMAMEYLSAKSQGVKEPTREDLVEYYRQHLNDYAVNGRARWKELRVSFEKHGGRDAARVVLGKAIAELRGGAEFGAVARQFSDGATAADGGQWDWIELGSLANRETEDAIFALPVGQISQVIEDANGYQLIQVTERQNAGHIPFEDEQDKIKKTLEQQAKRDGTKQAVEQLLQEASIETIFGADYKPSEAAS